MHTYTYVALYLRTYAYVHVCTLYMHIYLHMYIYLHNMVDIYVCVHVRRSNTVQYANGSLALSSVVEREEGTYTCVAANQGGNASLSHQLDVKGTLFVYACNLCMWFTVIAL